MGQPRLERGSLRELGCRALADLAGLTVSGLDYCPYDECMGLLQQHTGDGEHTSRPGVRIVFDPEAGLHVYDGGIWRQIDDWTLWPAIGRYDTAPYGPQARQINLSRTNVESAAWMARLVVLKPDYFKAALPGFAFNDAAYVVYDEKFQPATLEPSLRLRAGVQAPSPSIIHDDTCLTIPPFDDAWLAVAPPLKYIRDVIGDDPDDARAIQEIVGLGLLGVANRAAKGLALVGPPGGGKGTVADILRQVFPPDVVYEGPPVSTIKADYGRVVIVGKRLLVHNDVDDLGSVKEINRVISGEGINVRWLGGHPFTAYPTAAVLMTLNELPSQRSKESGGMFRRWVVIRCERELYQSGTTRQDILQACEPHRAGLAAWLVAGAARYMLNKRVSTSRGSADEVNRWRNESMPWLEWIAEHLTIEVHDGPALDLGSIVTRWGQHMSDRPGFRAVIESMDNRRFAAGIREVFPAVTAVHTKRGAAFSNLRWTSPAELRAGQRWGAG